jgi:hypothetical protein
VNNRAFGRCRFIRRRPRAGTAEIRRATVRATAALLLVFLGAGCGGSSSSDTGASTAPTKPTAASPSKSASIVGEWTRVTTCADYVRALKRAGFDEMALEAAAGNGFIPGVTSVDELEDPAHPCKGAIPRKHSHFFTSDGKFGSRDWNGNQVDEGTYKTVDDHTLVMPYRFEQGPPIEINFQYRIAGETIRFEPKIRSDCSTKRCREAAPWGVAVALPGKTWRRVG